jgi:hypothetical protein
MGNANHARCGLLAAIVCLAVVAMDAQQVQDSAFAPEIAEPAYQAGRGPRVVIDAAHLNFHTEDGGYAPFAKLLRLDGYRVEPNREPFTASSLGGADVLVIANAMHKQSEADWAPLPNYSAFTDAEIAEVATWVRRGGSLLLIADHMPLAGHAEGARGSFRSSISEWLRFGLCRQRADHIPPIGRLSAVRPDRQWPESERTG